MDCKKLEFQIVFLSALKCKWTWAYSLINDIQRENGEGEQFSNLEVNKEIKAALRATDKLTSSYNRPQNRNYRLNHENNTPMIITRMSFSE